MRCAVEVEDASHAVFISQPAAVAAVIGEAVAAVAAGEDSELRAPVTGGSQPEA
jgi:hypothetical protein